MNSITKQLIKKVIREQSELPTMDIYHISMGENWDKGYDHKSDLFFKDYDKAVEYLTSNIDIDTIVNNIYATLNDVI